MVASDRKLTGGVKTPAGSINPSSEDGNKYLKKKKKELNTTLIYSSLVNKAYIRASKGCQNSYFIASSFSFCNSCKLLRIPSLLLGITDRIHGERPLASGKGAPSTTSGLRAGATVALSYRE